MEVNVGRRGSGGWCRNKARVFWGGGGGINSIFFHDFELGGGTLCRIVFYIYFSTVLYVVNIAL
jgi:hypothetical protein